MKLVLTGAAGLERFMMAKLISRATLLRLMI